MLELEVNNLRGIKHLTIKPDAENLVIWGPNGSGKSSIVDAVDFLLTGKITRLTGVGAGVLALEKHGPHIDCENSEESWVKGAFRINGINEPVELRRCLKTPGLLEYDHIYKAQIESLLAIAGLGQHVLTRRDILHFITAQGATRAKEIQELLDITEIEKIRNALVEARNKLKVESEAATNNVGTEKGRIIAIAQTPQYDEKTLIEFINSKRQILSGEPVKDIISSSVIEGLVQPILGEKDEKGNFTLLESNVERLTQLESEQSKHDLKAKEEKLRKAIESSTTRPDVLRNLSLLQLFDIGYKLIDDSGIVPYVTQNGIVKNYSST